MNEVELNEHRMDRLAAAIEHACKGNKTEFGRRLGYKDGAFVRQMLSGIRPVTEKTVRAIEDMPGMRGWFDAPERATTTSAPSIPDNNLASDEVPIPQFDTGGKMGDGLELRDQPGMIKSWRVDLEWLNKNVRGATAAGNLCIVTGFGDSMRPMFNPGDPLLVDRGVVTAEYDAVYFFRVDGEGFIKRLQKIPGKGLVALSENPAYQAWVVEPNMDFEVFGRVLKVWRSEDF
ncbi:S24 family peptidase [Achromobacter sp. 2789STDY5608628]|uniref:S24 family peptidase n=1 Tax=Achromobacter sp. 2789STDY5608628 TaxID=1806493 RepID=UPI0006C1F5CB|nr:S24 family peptidase [Achromobacter sp. 2789STDY5608628]CUJ80950.1 DNA polymerase V subunit UmuD [Achromobacter sp. 2789STDY5608628]